MTSDQPPLPSRNGEPQGQGVIGTGPTPAGTSPTAHTPPDRPVGPTLENVPTARPVVADLGQLAAPLPYAPLRYAAKVQRMPMFMSRIRAGVELVLLLPAGVLGAWASYAIVTARWPLADPRWSHIADSLGMGFGCLLGLALLLRVAGHKDVTIGWTGKQFAANVGLGLAALVITYLVLAQVTIAAVILYPELLAEPSPAQKAIEKTFPPMSLWPVLLVTAFVVFWEEVVFRGFVLTRLQAVLRRWWLTLPVASAAFGLLHVYEGPLAVALITALALVMSGLFVWRKSLVPSMAYHLVHNVVIFQLLRSVSTTWQ